MLFKGILLGLALSAPIGMIGIWAIQRSINYGFRYGFATGMGAVIADLVFALLAAFGFSQFIAPYIQGNPWPSLIGALMIIYIGVSTIWKSNTNETVTLSNKPSLTRSFMGSFILIMTHPAAILVFLAVFSGLDIELNEQTPWLPVTQLLIGLVIGGTSWWLFLSATASYLGKKMSPRLMHKFNWASGLLVIGLGVWLGLSSFS